MRMFLAGVLLAGCTAASTEPEPPGMTKVVTKTEATGSEPAGEPIVTKVTLNASFNKGAAAKALGQVDLRSCATANGPVGSGHVTVTYVNDGSVMKAVVDDGPFPGTAVGGCIAGKFRAATVPAFTGAEVRVGKSFTLDPQGT